MAELDGGGQRAPPIRRRFTDAVGVLVEKRGDAIEIPERGGNRKMVVRPTRQQQPSGFEVAAAGPRTLFPESPG